MTRGSVARTPGRPRHIAVIDIGKTNAKLALVDLHRLTEKAVLTRPNVVRKAPPWPHYDVAGHWDFLIAGLAEFQRDHGIDAISVTTHGACAALLARDGTLAAPILDYEHDYPVAIAQEYATLKPDFARTGSPTLAGGLNIGAQLHWQFATDPTLHARTEHIVTYPQYWGHRLTGVASCDVTSIGCHTDLWLPHEGRFSQLPQTLGITQKIAPVLKPSDILGPVLPDIARHTGLAPDTPVCVGIHDSNASLYPHILAQEGLFSVVSTGTWVVAMVMGGTETPLDPSRDTLINVNAQGHAVPSARFMGGREYEMIQQGHTKAPSAQDVAEVLDRALMILPAVDPRTGPYAGQDMRWTQTEPAFGTGLRTATLSFYLAMMTDTCLRLAGAKGATIIEGPFARNHEFTAMLRAATGRAVLTSDAATGTSVGAALLFADRSGLATPKVVQTPKALSKYQDYATRWRSQAGPL